MSPHTLKTVAKEKLEYTKKVIIIIMICKCHLHIHVDSRRRLTTKSTPNPYRGTLERSSRTTCQQDSKPEKQISMRGFCSRHITLPCHTFSFFRHFGFSHHIVTTGMVPIQQFSTTGLIVTRQVWQNGNNCTSFDKYTISLAVVRRLSLCNLQYK